VQTLPLEDELLRKVADGTKRGTIRLGRRDVELGPLLLEPTSGTGWAVTVAVQRVAFCLVGDLTDADAIIDGCPSRAALVENLTRFYPHVTDSDTATVISFHPLTA
jgi:hypothetical protein